MFILRGKRGAGESGPCALKSDDTAKCDSRDRGVCSTHSQSVWVGAIRGVINLSSSMSVKSAETTIKHEQDYLRLASATSTYRWLVEKRGVM